MQFGRAVDHMCHCSPFTVDYPRLFSTTAVNNCKCMHRQVYRSSICNGGVSWRTLSVYCKRAQLGSMIFNAISPLVVTFIHYKGRHRWMSGLEAYAYKRGNTDVAYCY